MTPATANTDGHAPIFFANGCDPPNAATYSPLNATAAPVPACRRHCTAAAAPAAASTTPPTSRRPLHRATP